MAAMGHATMDWDKPSTAATAVVRVDFLTIPAEPAVVLALQVSRSVTASRV